MDGITRPLLERYLADLATDPRAQHSRSRDIGSLSAFLDAIRRHEWDPALPTAAVFYPDDFPKPDKRLPRGWPSTSWPRSNSQPTSIAGTTRKPPTHAHSRALRASPRGRLRDRIRLRCP
ncbi:hypothetical protein [Mycobacterium riyadhense]|uniref:hypothetical protein n=1 Tax=Mycobacterium riyadhense TaxID=486698 RepID=UPI001EF9E9C0|nr:hypothetical protein [Mycobacterium riyadhense]